MAGIVRSASQVRTRLEDVTAPRARELRATGVLSTFCHLDIALRWINSQLACPATKHTAVSSFNRQSSAPLFSWSTRVAQLVMFFPWYGARVGSQMECVESPRLRSPTFVFAHLLATMSSLIASCTGVRPTSASHVWSGTTPHVYRYEYAGKVFFLAFTYASLPIAFLCMAAPCTSVHISVLSRSPRYFSGRGMQRIVHTRGMTVHATHPFPSLPERSCATVRMYLSPSSIVSTWRS